MFVMNNQENDLLKLYQFMKIKVKVRKGIFLKYTGVLKNFIVIVGKFSKML